MARSLVYLAIVVATLAFAFGCTSAQSQPFPGGVGAAGDTGSGGTGTVSPAGYSCQAGQTLCGDSCVFLESNPAHCGRCNNACPAGTSCVDGECTCQSGLTSCNGECVDVTSDADNCGSCGHACAEGEVCSRSACTTSCAEGLTPCGRDCVDLNSNVLNCGECGNACAAGRLCQNGCCACEKSNETDCDGVCVDTQTDPANCGQCGNACTGGATCSAGTCVGGGGGTGGTGGSGGGGNVPDGLPGVALNGTCYPLCTSTTVGDDPENPDWGWENEASCVIPNTQTAAGGLECVTGEPLPTVNLDGRAGVVIDGTCYLLCTTVTEPSSTESPDWGFESGSSCVLPGTCTAAAQACVIGESLPDPSELDGRNGVVVLDFDSGVKTCVPLCTCYTDPAADPEGDDWAYEYGASCVIPGTPTGQNQACLTGGAIPDPESVPGVVTLDSAGNLICSPLCTLTTNAADDPTEPLGDGWSYENNMSCVIPGTAAAETNQACMTGDTNIVIDNSGLEGVVVFLKDDVECDGDSNDCSGAWNCIPNCDYYTSPTQDGANDDGLADDWAWENNDSCIIPGTITSHNTACVTGEPIPDPEPRPGIMVNGDPVENSCGWSECVPICRVVTEASDTDYPDWGWEDNNSCVIPNSDTHLWLPEGDLPRGCKEWDSEAGRYYTDAELEQCRQQYGYQQAPRPCTWGEPQPDFLAPPALDSGRIVHGTGGRGHFQTVGAELQDPYGARFVIRGINNSHGWYDTCGQYMAYGALDNIANAGANTVRVGWAFESIDPVGPNSDEPEKEVIGTNATLLAEILYEIVRLQMIPIVAINDSTGQTTTDWPNRIANFWLSNGYQEVMQAYEAYLLVGLANEWNGTDFYTAYNQAVQTMRSAGINNTLVITANEWGQGCMSILDNASRLLDADPLGNLLFDIHIYTYLDWGNCRNQEPWDCGAANIVQGCLDDIAAAQIPLLVGEFGHQHSSGTVEWQTIISRADANSQGYCPWLWFGDTEYRVLDLNDSWEGPLSDWGNYVLPLTASKASIFQ
jgi:hypothetical protein